MQISCVNCRNLSTTVDGSYPVTQAWCSACQKPTAFLPVFSGNYDANQDYDTSPSVSLEQFEKMLEQEFEQVHALVSKSLGGKLTRDNLGNLVWIDQAYVNDLEWVFETIRRHPIWCAQLYNLAMNIWR